jgi:hypothetical protein
MFPDWFFQKQVPTMHQLCFIVITALTRSVQKYNDRVGFSFVVLLRIKNAVAERILSADK